MSRKTIQIALLVCLVATLFLVSNAVTPTYDASVRTESPSDKSLRIVESPTQIAGIQDEASWWNTSYIYRRYFNITEPGISDRRETPVHLYLTFSENHCYSDSLRVAYHDSSSDSKWTLLPFQTWNVTYDSSGNYVQSTRISFLVNVSKGQTEMNYYVYYAKEDVGSVTYPDFYPFVYKSYTFSLLNMVSYYDANNYTVAMWDDVSSSWKDPRDVDARWSGADGSVYPSDVPSGTLDRFKNARYEPSSYSYTHFQGYYRVQSNYPLGVHMGQGDEGYRNFVNDWFPGVDQLGNGIATEWIIGGVEGASGGTEGRYWVQAHTNDTEVYAWNTTLHAANNWALYNSTEVSSWPVILDEGEFIFKKEVDYREYHFVNSTKPVSVRSGDTDCSYARDIWGFYPSVDGSLVGEEFYTIGMGNNRDGHRITNLGDSQITIEWWRNAGSGYGSKNTLTISPNEYGIIEAGSASDTDPEDIVHIKGPDGSKLMVEGVMDPSSYTDAGDWSPTTNGYRFGIDFKLWAVEEYKPMIVALENAQVNVTGYNNDTITIPKGGMAYFHPKDTSLSLYHFESNATIGIVNLGEFETSDPYSPTGDTGYGWMVPCYSPEQDSEGFSVVKSDEVHLFEFDITVADLDGEPVEGASVTLYNATDGNIWEDDQGNNRTGITDENGLVIFEGLNNATYNITTRIDAASWLTTSHSNIWVRNSSNHAIMGSITEVEILMEMGSFDLHFEDLMGDPMAQTADETTTIRASDITDGSADGSDFIAQASTNATGWAEFYRLPKRDYVFLAKYSGNVSSYDYDEIKEFAGWSISADEFGPEPFTHNWTMPLVTLRVHVVSWDDQNVSGATVKLNNSMNENKYTLTEYTDDNGNYNFYRIINGSWNFHVWKDDEYVDTPLVENYTVGDVNIQGEYEQTINVAISRLIVRVYTGTDTYVENAQVNVSLEGIGLVAQGTTNSSGYITFFNIHANMTTPYAISYNLTVESGDKDNSTSEVKCDYDWNYENWIKLDTVTYADSYTELNSTLYSVSKKWGQNASFTVGYYDKDGENDTKACLDDTSWLKFKIYGGGTLIGSDTYSDLTDTDWIKKTSDINFTITIDTDYWKLNVSDTAYSVQISAHTDTYDNPKTITIYVTVNAAQTSVEMDETIIEGSYRNHTDHWYIMNDTTNEVNVTGLITYAYLIKQGSTIISSGDLTLMGEKYVLPSSALHNLDVDDYTMRITFEKRNYVNQTVLIDITVTEVPMKVVSIAASDYTWSLEDESITFEYLISNDTNPGLSGVTVDIEWLTSAGESYLNISKTLSGDVLIYSFYKNLLPVGKWNLTVICSKTNYQAAIGTLSDMIEVSSAPTDLDLSNGYTSTVTVDWRETAVFEVNFTRTSDGAGLTGASHFENWTDVISLDAQGSGRYLVELDTNLPATTYTLNLTMWLDNHLSSEISLTVTILVPLVIEGDYIQGEEPMDVYWTHEFDLDFALKDQSRGGDPVQSAILTYDWYRDGVIDQQGTLNEYSGGIYNDTLNAYDAEPSPDSYGILITAEKAGCTTAQVTLHVRINEVPNEVVVRQDYFEQYYGDNITVYFYWNNTLDNQPIEYPDSAWIEIWGRGSNITNGMNYHNGTFSFEVHTKAMKMYPDDDSGFKLYTFKLEMNAMGYAEHSTPSLAVLVLETPTRMDVADLSAVEWDDPLTITVNLTDSVHDELIWNEAVVELVYGDIRRPMESYFNGTFYVTIETEDYFSGQDEPYDLSIEYSLPNYEDGEINLEVTVEPRRAEIDIIPESLKDQVYEGDWSDIVDISFLVSRVDQTGIKVRYATASYSWVEYPSITGPFSFNNDTDIYGLSLNTTEVPAGVRTLRITVTRENYTISPFDIQMTLNPLTADLSTDITSLSKIHTVETTAELSFTLTYGDEVLDAARVQFEWGGVQRTASFVNSEYIFEFNPSVEGIEVPKTYLLNFTTDIQNYTVDTVSIPLTMLAPTELTGPAVYLEEDQSGTAYFRYWDTYNDRPVADDDDASPSINVYFPGDDDSIQPEFNGTHYYFSLEAADLGEAQTDPYEILLTATAGSYQNHTTTSGEDAVTLNVYVSPPTYNIPLIGRVQRSLVNLALIMFGLFVLVVGSAVGVKRWRRPHAIKQIESAIRDMEENKTAKVKDIKSMGMVVSELLAPGLAELDMKAPTIDTGPEVEFEAGLGEEAEDLLGELDALDEISKEEPAAVEESTDYEAQIEAELEAMDEEEMQVSDIPGIGPTIEDRLANAEYTTVSALSEADPLVLAEIEGISENKAEQIVDEARAMVSEPVEEDIESEAEEEERPPEEDVEEILPEDEAEAALTEEDMEDELPEGESEDILSEESELSDDEATAEKDEPEVEKPKTKRELIEQLPDEIKETMGDDEIRKLSKRELEALIEDQEYSEK